MRKGILRAVAAGMAMAFCQGAHAVELPVELYGKVNVSRDSADPGNDDWKSNASRVGVKGGYELDGGLEVIYQVEQQVDYAHGGTDIDTLLATRNTFIGLKGQFGRFFFGTHDTPFKRAQARIDLFNDQVGDIKTLVPGEVRARDSWVYHSPKLASGLSLRGMYVPSDRAFGSSKSLSVGWDSGDLHVGFGVDFDMRKNERAVARTRVYDSWRAVLQYTPGSWKFGALVQSSEQTNAVGADRETAYVASAAYKFDKLTLMGQYGASDILRSDAEQLLLGAAYKVAQSTKIYLYLSDLESGGAVDTISAGFEFKF
ncbi:MAG: hypothetical protein CMD83_16030 [Gammaproteobacteria bacterium]|nr:hypothetical protein [Gammaproteobacteria bacterium]